MRPNKKAFFGLGDASLNGMKRLITTTANLASAGRIIANNKSHLHDLNRHNPGLDDDPDRRKTGHEASAQAHIRTPRSGEVRDKISQTKRQVALANQVTTFGAQGSAAMAGASAPDGEGFSYRQPDPRLQGAEVGFHQDGRIRLRFPGEPSFEVPPTAGPRAFEGLPRESRAGMARLVRGSSNLAETSRALGKSKQYLRNLIARNPFLRA